MTYKPKPLIRVLEEHGILEDLPIMYKEITSEPVFRFKKVYEGRYQVLHQEVKECPTSVEGSVYQSTVIGQIEKLWVERKQTYCWFEVGDNSMSGRYNIPYGSRLAASYGIVKQRIKAGRLQPAFA